MKGRLEGAIAEIGDLLYYCNDIINSGVPALRPIMTKHIMNILVLPLLLPSLRPVEISAITPSVRFSDSQCFSMQFLCVLYLMTVENLLRMCTSHVYILLLTGKEVLDYSEEITHIWIKFSMNYTWLHLVLLIPYR